MTDPIPQNDHEVVRITQLLSAAVRFSNTTQREVERKLGLSSGSLSRLFSGGIELKVKHVLDVCSAIDLPPDVVFRAAYPPKASAEESHQTQRILRLLEQLHPDLDTPQPLAHHAPAPALSETEVEAIVHRALLRFLASLSTRTVPVNGTAPGFSERT